MGKICRLRHRKSYILYIKKILFVMLVISASHSCIQMSKWWVVWNEEIEFKGPVSKICIPETKGSLFFRVNNSWYYFTNKNTFRVNDLQGWYLIKNKKEDGVWLTKNKKFKGNFYKGSGEIVSDTSFIHFLNATEKVIYSHDDVIHYYENEKIDDLLPWQKIKF